MDIGSAGEQIPSLDSQDSQYESDIKPDLMETSTNNGNSDGGPNQGKLERKSSLFLLYHFSIMSFLKVKNDKPNRIRILAKEIRINRSECEPILITTGITS